MKEKKQLSVGAVIFNPKNKVLIMYQKSNKYWEFPKGKQEPGETILDTLKREIAEETGITDFKEQPQFKEIINYSFQLDARTRIKKKVIFYLLRTNEEARLSDEHQDCKWVTLKQAQKYFKHQNQKKLIDKILKYAF